MAEAIMIRETGGPEVLKLETVEIGDPGPGQVRLRHEAIGLNFIDVYFRTGLYKAPNTPFVPGNEGAGVVIAVGPDVQTLRPGDRVAYTGAMGSYASERLMPAGMLVKLPESIGFDTAAAMMLKGLTANYLLRRTFRVEKGHTILLHAAAGGVGLIACQWAKRLGATVIGTVGSDEKAELARSFGCDHTIKDRTENFVDRVKAITGGKGCDVVYDSVGKDTYMGSLDCLKPFGMWVLFGQSSGPVTSFDMGVLASKGSLYATRPTLFTHIGDRATLDQMASELMEAIASGDVKISVNQKFALADAADAHRALEGRKTTGGTVLIPSR